MENRATAAAISARLTRNRAELLEEFPFFGRLLLRLRFGLSKCGTAYTDMQSIVFDPEFVWRISDEELKFVMLHEVMHCVLKHCLRGRTLLHRLYNVACDTVVNSCILEVYGREEFTVDGCQVFHRAPDGNEGNRYTAEEIYYMFLKDGGSPEGIELSGTLDSHAVWDSIKDPSLSDVWEANIREASRSSNWGSGVPGALKRYLKEISHTPKTNWRQLLQDYIRNDSSDFTYLSPDRRYQGDVIMPSFQADISGEMVENLWFLVDTSGSISDKALAQAFGEVQDAVEQIDTLRGEISFFDTAVTDPVPFETVEELRRVKPVGGGGTNFAAIFRYMRQHMAERLPSLVIILTDGYCNFPDESAAMGVPVVWIIVNSGVEPPWGQKVHIEN